MMGRMTGFKWGADLFSILYKGVALLRRYGIGGLYVVGLVYIFNVSAIDQGY